MRQPDNNINSQGVRAIVAASHSIGTAHHNVQLALVLVGSLPEQERRQDSNSPEALEPHYPRQRNNTYPLDKHTCDLINP